MHSYAKKLVLVVAAICFLLFAWFQLGTSVVRGSAKLVEWVEQFWNVHP